MTPPADGSAAVLPTGNYELFEQAEAWRVSLRQMLSGAPGPLTTMERYLWRRYYLAQQRLRNQALKGLQ